MKLNHQCFSQIKSTIKQSRSLVIYTCLVGIIVGLAINTPYSRWHIPGTTMAEPFYLPTREDSETGAGTTVVSDWRGSEISDAPEEGETVADTTSKDSDTLSQGKTIIVKADEDLQAAINKAVPGDTILLEAGATFSGPFTLPRKPEPFSTWVALVIGGIISLIIYSIFRKHFSIKRLNRAPGTILLLLADFLYSKKTVEEVFRPIVADWRTEYFDALKEGRTLKSRWLTVRYAHTFLLAMGLSKIFSLLRSFTSTAK